LFYLIALQGGFDGIAVTFRDTARSRAYPRLAKRAASIAERNDGASVRFAQSKRRPSSQL